MFIKERIDTWLYWIREREAIRQLREQGKPPPWTTDPVMAGTRFTNVRRMDDKVSRWLLQWYGTELSPQEAVVAATFGRLVNRPETLDIYSPGWPGWSTKSARAAMRIRAAQRRPVFTGAYIINSAEQGSSKIETVLSIVNTVVSRAEVPGWVNTWTMQAMHSNLTTVPGIGSFIAGQIVADMRHIARGDWDDRHTWAPVGPGSARGAAWLLGRDVPVRTQREFEDVLAALMNVARRRVPKIHCERKLEAMDYQNTLCELSKYVRVKSGGRAKNRYVAAPTL